jgi:MraZ protein
MRVVFGSASDQQLDRQGRVALPQALRVYAGLDRDVTVVGVADHLEIWDASKWGAISEASDAAYADLEAALTEEGS